MYQAVYEKLPIFFHANNCDVTRYSSLSKWRSRQKKARGRNVRYSPMKHFLKCSFLSTEAVSCLCYYLRCNLDFPKPLGSRLRVPFDHTCMKRSSLYRSRSSSFSFFSPARGIRFRARYFLAKFFHSVQQPLHFGVTFLPLFFPRGNLGAQLTALLDCIL